MRPRQRSHPSAFGTSPFRGGSLIVSLKCKGKAVALVPPLKGEGDREAVERFCEEHYLTSLFMNGNKMPHSRDRKRSDTLKCLNSSFFFARRKNYIRQHESKTSERQEI